MAEGLKEGIRAPDRSIDRGAGAREIAEAKAGLGWPIRDLASQENAQRPVVVIVERGSRLALRAFVPRRGRLETNSQSTPGAGIRDHCGRVY
jgi:hypothetical protein